MPGRYVARGYVLDDPIASCDSWNYHMCYHAAPGTAAGCVLSSAVSGAAQQCVLPIAFLRMQSVACICFCLEAWAIFGKTHVLFRVECDEDICLETCNGRYVQLT